MNEKLNHDLLYLYMSGEAVSRTNEGVFATDVAEANGNFPLDSVPVFLSNEISSAQRFHSRSHARACASDESSANAFVSQCPFKSYFKEGRSIF